MIDRIIDFSVRNKLAVFAAVSLAALAGWWSMQRVPLDAIPDLSDTQVIIYSRWNQSPDIVEDQVTYPIVSAMTGAPGVRAVRGISDFGYSFVYVIFDDGTDLYWARSRTLEYLSPVLQQLPDGVRTELGPDAIGLGWIYQYALVDTTGNNSLADLRTYQDWYLRYYLEAVPGVAEVATVGGYQKQYQVTVDPNRLRGYGIGIQQVVDAVRDGTAEVGGRLMEFGGTEYMVRGRGYAESVEDFEEIVVGRSELGSPIRVKDLGEVMEGPDLRRGIAELDGKGEVVQGIVIMRHEQNALEVIDAVEERLEEIAPGLPEGVEIVVGYDRSELIHRSVDNLERTIIEVILTLCFVILLFLWHLPSAVIPIVTIPLAVLISFVPFEGMGLTANIMSLGGIAIAIGALGDAAIVVVEQTHKKLEEWERGGRRGDPKPLVQKAISQVASTSFFTLLVIGVSFLPVLALEAEEGRLFKPLAYTKTLAMVVAAILAITLDPALRMLLTRLDPYDFKPAWLCRLVNKVWVGKKIRDENDHPISRFLIWIYAPVAAWALRRKWWVIAGAVALIIVTVPVFLGLGSEFMPPLEEGSLMYMPTTMPGISITEANNLLQITDRIIASFPEVDRVLGKVGRADTSTDPAPLSMIETVVTLKPKSEWRKRDTWYSSWAPEWLKTVFRRVTPDHISQDQLIDEMNEALRLPGLSNAWTMPIKGRMDMIATGIRTPVGLKISGADLETIEEIAVEVEEHLKTVRGARSVYAERTAGGYFLDIDWDRKELARYGISIREAQDVLAAAVGGRNITTTIEGRERFSVNVRYYPDYRADLDSVGRILVPVGADQRQVPLEQLAEISISSGPGMIRNDDGLTTGYVYVDLAGRDPESFVEEAEALLRANLELPAGYAISWSGQYEAMERVEEKLEVVVPVTIVLILMLLYLNTRSAVKTMIVILAVPFSAIGAVWLLHFLGYNMSIGVWVGLIALLGVDAETGVFMLLYLDLAYAKAKEEGKLNNLAELRAAIMEGAVHRLRPKFMTVMTTFLALLPIMWSMGAGADTMKRIAAPMIGGIFTSFLLELLIYPGIYEIWKWNFVLKRGRAVDDAH
ncbi:MAG: CusA/CzcA family heavy metal efflux RND transporter [Candidatus Sulfomarinibacteraceae bacterium]